MMTVFGGESYGDFAVASWWFFKEEEMRAGGREEEGYDSWVEW